MSASENAKAPAWPKGDDDKAHRMWIKGDPVRDIAAAVKRSRNSVVGRANRQGWGLHPSRKFSGQWGRA